MDTRSTRCPCDYVWGDNVKGATHYELRCGRSFKDTIIAGRGNPERAVDWQRKSLPPYGAVATVRHLSRAAAQGQEALLSDRRGLSSGRVRERGSGWAEDKGSCCAPVSFSDQPIRRGNSAESAAGWCSRPNAGGGGVGGGRGASQPVSAVDCSSISTANPMTRGLAGERGPSR